MAQGGSQGMTETERLTLRNFISASSIKEVFISDWRNVDSDISNFVEVVTLPGEKIFGLPLIFPGEVLPSSEYIMVH